MRTRRHSKRMGWIALVASTVVLTACATDSPLPEPAPGFVEPEPLPPAPDLEARTTSRPDQMARPAAVRLLETTRFDLNVQAADLPTLLLGLGRDSPLNIVVDRNVTGIVTADLQDASMIQILDEIVIPRGYRYETRGNSLHIFAPTRETRVYSIDYPSYKRDASSDLSLSGFIASTPSIGDGGGAATDSSLSSVITAQKQDFWQSLEQDVRGLVFRNVGAEDVGEGGDAESAPALGSSDDIDSVIVSPQSGIVTITAGVDALARVEAYLRAVASTLDRQVLIDAQIFEVTLDDNFVLGVDYEIAPSFNNAAGAFARAITPGLREATIVQMLAPVLEDGGLSMGVANDDFGFIVRMLATQKDVRVLSTPRIATLNNHTALIKVVRNDVFFIAQVKTEVVEAVGTTQTVEFVPKIIPVGVTLHVTPQISNDSTITMHVHPSISEVVSVKLQPQADPSLEQVGSLPVIDQREADTVLRVKDGQTIVIGGLIQSSEYEEERKVPLLGDIPYFGFLFKSTRTDERRTELLIFLRPILLDAPVIGRTTDQLAQGGRDMDELFRKRSLGFPWWRQPWGETYGVPAQ